MIFRLILLLILTAMTLLLWDIRLAMAQEIKALETASHAHEVIGSFAPGTQTATTSVTSIGSSICGPGGHLGTISIPLDGRRHAVAVLTCMRGGTERPKGVAKRKDGRKLPWPFWGFRER